MPRLSKIGAACLAAFGWTSGTGISPVTASYLVVAGGGAGAGGIGGGGGGGGYLTGTTPLDPTLSYTVTVGAGGTIGAVENIDGTNGGNSSIGSTVVSIGGGAGGHYNTNGYVGGSGGGGGRSATGAAGTSGQGNAGGNGDVSGAAAVGGGGGGAGAAGANGVANSSGGNGGNGSASSISGSSVTYAGGGGGGIYQSTGTPGTGGTGGGGNGNGNSSTTTLSGFDGTVNLGGGGGGGSGNNGLGGKGGSGIVIISYAGAQQFGGGVVTTDGTNTIHTFNTSGTLSPISSLSASYLIVAGGGGGSAAGAGAGGMLTGSGVSIDTASTYLVTVGSGGTGSSSTPTNGGNSVFGIVSTAAIGGGAGGVNVGSNGGSGGGGASPSAGGSGTSGQGNNGGGSVGTGSPYPMGGGGGAGAVGGDASGSTSGNGGAGLASSISGTSTYYAGGGGGASTSQGSTAGTGGTGGGGNGATASVAAQNGTANLGGGGGGYANQGGSAPGNGGSGVVIIAYAGSTQLMAGGTVTITGGNVIHTFTSSGYLTPLKYVGNSLRTRRSASAYLSKTPTTIGTGAGKLFTASMWIKRGAFTSGSYQELMTGVISGTSYGYFGFNTSDQFVFNQSNSGSFQAITTSQVFRDPAAWYHIVVAYDSANTTSTNRVKIYVNGTQVTSFATSTYPPQNSVCGIMYNNATYIATFDGSSEWFDGYFSEINFIDGQALTPNAFGTFNSYGVWQPITYGGSYGTNGFYLPFNSSRTSSYAGTFGGTDSIRAASVGPFTNSTFTIECWTYFSGTASSQAAFDLAGATGGYGCFFQVASGTSNYQMNFYSNNTGTQIGVITTPYAGYFNKWVHVAVSYDGSTYRLFLNGILKGTLSSGTTITNIQSITVGGRSDATQISGYAWVGQISNFRYVVGTCLYTTNFIPSTSPLTNITNTQLLTCQNSTFIDNSSNAYTITSQGSPTSAVQYPFSISVFDDQSPQGNNWVNNNISGANGSTYDYMTDVPTLTSATAANYPTMNPLIPNSATFSNGNLTYSSSGATRNWSSTMALPISGKWYMEGVFTSGPFLGGLGISQTPDGTAFPAYDYFLNENGNIYVNGSIVTNIGTSWVVGDILGCVADMDNNKLYWYKNNTLLNSGGYSITAPTSGNPYFWFGNNYTSSISVNFGQQPFVYTPPLSSIALNAYNI